MYVCGDIMMTETYIDVFRNLSWLFSTNPLPADPAVSSLLPPRVSLTMYLDRRLSSDAAQLHNLHTDKSERDVRKSIWR